MKKRSIKITILAMVMILLLPLATACGSGGNNETLVIYTWESMFDSEVLKEFEEETGITVEYATFDYNETMLSKLQANGGSEYDIVVADDYIIESVIADDLAMEIDTDKISTIGNINPLYQSQFYDPENKYTVPYGAGIPLIVYDEEAVGFEITSYEDLWDERLENNLALIGNYRVINGITFNSMGYGLNEEDLDITAQAGEKLKELAPNVRAISDSNTQDFLLSGEVAAAFLYTSQVHLALAGNPDLELCYPEEGVGFGIMNAFIPANAPNSDAAHQFLEFINRPEIAARLFESLGFYTTNKASEEFISEELQELLIVPESIDNGETIKTINQEADDLQLKNWNEFKQAAGQ